ncbi:hypothetical protein E8E13_002168 [Curvularia kusanoi]|uniref:Uncharacterized protein n=1 Tax=Curvularia kusanoi TaxID=90978 RepID=A0A9P4T6U0_CURKU|nr:hypothetical protein E8E13_002168 [Curvularia kusanoi]
MASPHQTWRSSQTTASNSSGSRMNDIPADLSPSQKEAQAILRHLLSRLKDPDSKYYARLKLIAGDLRADSRAVYLNGILGLDKRVRIYVGQASSLRQRIAQHLNFRYRRDNPSLHYHALQASIYNAIGVLAILPSPNMGGHTLPGMDDPGLLLNVLEMWMGLVFRTLPAEMLEDWMPNGVSPARREGKEGLFGGLNIRSPLDQGESKSDWIDLSDSDDILIREYVNFGLGQNEAHTRLHNDTEKRKKDYAEKARKRNQTEKGDGIAANTILAFGMGVVLGFALVKGFSGLKSKS